MELNEMSELVSVIVPMYNHARYIQQCLDSVYNEDYPNIELIIIDDGSNDESVEVAKKWRESHQGKFHRFHIETQENQGICKTLNRLVSIAEGEYIVLLASDDYLIKGGIEAKVSALKKNPQWLAVFSDAILIDPDSNIVSHSAIEYYNVNRYALQFTNLMAQQIIMFWTPPMQIMVFKKKAFNPIIGVGLYDETMCFEDRDMCLRLLAKQAYGFIDTRAYAYRVRIRQEVTPGVDTNSKRKDFHIISGKVFSHFSGINNLFLRAQYQSYVDRSKNKIYFYFWRLLMLILRGYYYFQLKYKQHFSQNAKYN
ncbi:glycosyltransferase [Aphanizomenon sp. UHCC 0183]|uniref:glycosyltransferase n=1 Tax=Aphanizomenon sp. UHCC 0183 TaxID=2590028 RepID=UPI001447E4AF|nr:glycosyltransferase [Aphanizomenon sp. UHCC 0183]MTJ29929.1 glycosyltransferase [Aphanizomenon sp. UHCC 0183]